MGSEIKRNRKVIKELSNNAAKKFNFIKKEGKHEEPQPRSQTTTIPEPQPGNQNQGTTASPAVEQATLSGRPRRNIVKPARFRQ